MSFLPLPWCLVRVTLQLDVETFLNPRRVFVPSKFEGGNFFHFRSEPIECRFFFCCDIGQWLPPLVRGGWSRGRIGHLREFRLLEFRGGGNFFHLLLHFDLHGPAQGPTGLGEVRFFFRSGLIFVCRPPFFYGEGVSF